MKKFLSALALSAMLGVAACAGNPATVALQTEAAGYDTLNGFAGTADKLCTDGTLDHDKCVTVKHDIRTAKTLLDEGNDITGLVTTITGELK